MKHFERELPAGYAPAFTIDAADKKTGVRLNLIGGGIMAALIALFALTIRPKNFLENYSLSRSLLVLAALFAYLVLHELTHGAVYKLLTRQKLTFGFTATVAYCGVPDIYVYRTAALLALLAPFCVFNVAFGLAVGLLINAWDKMCAALLLAIHVGGCVGDLYDAWLYFTRFTDPRTLMRDTGPKQTFYLPEK